MIRPLEAADYGAVIGIVNDCWRSLYAGYVNPALLNGNGCRRRAVQMEREFLEGLRAQYVWEEDGRVLGLLSAGDTADPDRAGSFEIWRLYLAPAVRGRGIGGQLLDHAEALARAGGHRETLVWAFRENEKAVRFYERHGYRKDRTAYLGEPYQAHGVRLIKRL